MIGALVGLLVLCIVIGIVYVIFQKIPFPPEWRWLVYVVFLLIVLFAILNYLPLNLPRGRWG